MSITDRLWARLEPLGWIRYEYSEGVRFYSPDGDGGIYCDGNWIRLRLHKASLTAWAAGLRAVADVVEKVGEL